MQISFTTPVICPLLIGRTAELSALRLLVDRANGGKGQVALLFGEAGIGKSRLVAETRTYAVAQGFLLVQGNCFPTDHACPYGPLLDVVRSLLATPAGERLVPDLGALVQVLFPLLPELISQPSDLPPLPSLDPEQEKRRLFAALAQLFISQTSKQPVLLIVEDLHWSDETSLEFLHYLARRLVSQPMLLLLTYRSDEVRPGLRHWLTHLDRERLTQQCSLSHLTHSEVDAMLHAIFDVRRAMVLPLAQRELLERIYALTEGNPFFIEEVLSSLLAAGERVDADEAWKLKSLGELHIPPSIQDAVQQRVDHLSEEARHVLQVAAVAGRRFDFALLQQVTHHDEPHLLLDMKEMMAAQLVVEESAEQFAFRHALTQQAVSAQLLVRERKALHHTIAQALEQVSATGLDARLADLASHFYEAGEWAKALEYAQRAGERAQRLYAPRVAIEQYTWAMEAAGHLALAPLPRLYRARGQAYETLGKFEQAEHDYTLSLDAACTANDRVAEWQSLMDLGFLWAGRDYTQTGTWFRQALALAQTLNDPALRAHSLNHLGNWYVNVEQPLEALHYHQEALTMFQEMHDQHGVAETLDLLGMASFHRGDYVQSAAYYRQAIGLFGEMDNREGLVSSLATLLLCGDTYWVQTLLPVATSAAEVLQVGERALSLARQIDQRSGEAYTCCCMAEGLGSRGEYTHALKLAQEGLAIAEEIDHRQWMTLGHKVLGLLYRDLLELTMARGHLEQALALAQEMGSTLWIHSLLAHLALVRIELKDLAQAEALLSTALDSHAPPQTAMQRLIWYARAQLALAQGKPDRALALTEQLFAPAANGADEQSLPHLAHLRGKALTRLNQLAEAETALQAAHAVAMTRGIRPLLWRIAIDLGHLYQGQRRDEEVEQARALAQELIEALAACIPDPALHDHFLQQATALLPRPQPLSPRRAAKRAFAGLTQREREVAVLIAEGKSNREIADVLVVNYRTIEAHVSNILSKLGLTSRAQIAVWATEKGLRKTEQQSF